MAARLISEEGDLKDLVLSFEGEETWVIGRDPDECQLVIHDPLVSRRHALANLQPEGIYIENLSETNPIQINDEVIGNEPRLLRHGDTVRIGNQLFRYYTDPEAHVLDEELPSEVDIDQEEPLEDELDEEEFEAESEEIEYPEEPSLETPETPQATPERRMEDKTFDTILSENEEEFAPIAEIDFGLVEAGRWLVKVVGGPNNGAEFYMQTGNSYILGTDPNTCDIVFHDTSVSRQHAKIIVSPEDDLSIEDLKSRNGVMIAGKLIDGTEALQPNSIVTVGTTSFIVYDREGEMQTIISPLLPSILKVLQGQSEEEKLAKEEEAKEPFVPVQREPEVIEEPAPPPAPKPKPFGGYLLVAMLMGLFIVVGLGTAALFKSEPVQTTVNENAEELINNVLAPYQPSVKYAYNKANGGLLLIGHISTNAEKEQLLYNLHSMPFIKNIDPSGIVIDEGVWREFNSILSKTPAWKGISVHSPAAGQFVLTGTLQTRKQAEQLSDYVSLNFPYLDLLKREVVVEEDVISQINSWLHNAGLNNVTPQIANGDVTLTGSVPTDLSNAVNEIVAKIKTIPGVRIVNNYTKVKSADMGIINLSTQYQVTGSTKVGDKYTVIINGRILSEGDQLDGMQITSITPNTVFLQKENAKYRIDYK